MKSKNTWLYLFKLHFVITKSRDINKIIQKIYIFFLLVQEVLELKNPKFNRFSWFEIYKYKHFGTRKTFSDFLFLTYYHGCPNLVISPSMYPDTKKKNVCWKQFFFTFQTFLNIIIAHRVSYVFFLIYIVT